MTTQQKIKKVYECLCRFGKKGIHSEHLKSITNIKDYHDIINELIKLGHNIYWKYEYLGNMYGIRYTLKNDLSLDQSKNHKYRFEGNVAIPINNPFITKKR